MPLKIETPRPQFFIFITLLLVICSAIAIFNMLIIGQSFIHHAFICTAILGVAAYYAEKYGKNVIIKVCIIFACFGMSLGLYEVISLLFFPAYTPQSICSVLFIK